MRELRDALVAGDDAAARCITERAAAVDGQLGRMLHIAIPQAWNDFDNVTITTCLLEAGASLQARQDGDTPLLSAVKRGRLEQVQILLSAAHARGELRARLQDTDGHGNVFNRVAARADLPILKAILTSLDFLKSQAELATAVQTGVGMHGFTQDIANLCIAHLPFPGLDARDRDGHTPLTALCAYYLANPDALAAARLLVKHGADPGLTTHAMVWDPHPDLNVPGASTALDICQREFDVREVENDWDDYDVDEREQAAQLISYLKSVTDEVEEITPNGLRKPLS